MGSAAARAARPSATSSRWTIATSSSRRCPRSHAKVRSTNQWSSRRSRASASIRTSRIRRFHESVVVAIDFTLPELGENVASGDVLRVLVKPGDVLAKDQPVVELETDKATIEVPSSVAGRVKDVKVKVGDKVKVGQAILSVDEAAGESAPAQAAASSQPSAKAGSEAPGEGSSKAEASSKTEESPKRPPPSKEAVANERKAASEPEEAAEEPQR